LRKQYELLQQQNYDDVTELQNRILALDRMTQVSAYSDRTQQNTSILFVDVDNFKSINKILGSEVGNKVLVEIATRLTDCIRKDDTLAWILRLL
jgi:diguanylate cyclase (GGDEF)-like protein